MLIILFDPHITLSGLHFYSAIWIYNYLFLVVWLSNPGFLLSILPEVDYSTTDFIIQKKPIISHDKLMFTNHTIKLKPSKTPLVHRYWSFAVRTVVAFAELLKHFFNLIFANIHED